MNKARRKVISDLISRVEELREQVEAVAEEEREFYDNAPDNLRESERYTQAEEAADNLESAVSSLEEVQSLLENASE